MYSSITDCLGPDVIITVDGKKINENINKHKVILEKPPLPELPELDSLLTQCPGNYRTISPIPPKFLSKKMENSSNNNISVEIEEHPVVKFFNKLSIFDNIDVFYIMMEIYSKFINLKDAMIQYKTIYNSLKEKLNIKKLEPQIKIIQKEAQEICDIYSKNKEELVNFIINKGEIDIYEFYETETEFISYIAKFPGINHEEVINDIVYNIIQIWDYCDKLEYEYIKPANKLYDNIPKIAEDKKLKYSWWQRILGRGKLTIEDIKPYKEKYIAESTIQNNQLRFKNKKNLSALLDI